MKGEEVTVLKFVGFLAVLSFENSRNLHRASDADTSPLTYGPVILSKL